MTINWKNMLPFIIPTLILLVAVHNSPQVQNILYTENNEDYNSFINLQKTRSVYLSEIIDTKFLNINTQQPDTLKYFNINPKQLIYGEQGTIVLFIDGVNEYRKIKIFVTDQNNIIRFADDKTASYINDDINNESIFYSNSKQISIEKNTKINFNILPSNDEIIDGVWKINILIFQENGETSLFISKEIAIEKESTDLDYTIIYMTWIIFSIMASIVIFREEFISFIRKFY